MPSKTREFIRSEWRRSDLLFKPRGRPGVSIRSVVAQSKKVNNQARTPVLDNWMLLYDECLSWLVSLWLVLAARLYDKEQSKRSDVAAYIVLLSSIISTLFSARHLVIAGYDVQARQIVRSLREHADLFIAMYLDKSLIPLFLKTDTPERGNQFWHSKISKRKLRKRIDKHWKDELGLGDTYQAISEWRDEEESVLSMAAHPTMMSGFMATAVPGFKETQPWPGIFGARGATSIRTLAYAIFSVGDLALLVDDVPFKPHERRPPIVRYDKESELHVHVENGRRFVAQILLYVSINQDEPDLGDWSAIDHWF